MLLSDYVKDGLIVRGISQRSAVESTYPDCAEMKTVGNHCHCTGIGEPIAGRVLLGHFECGLVEPGVVHDLNSWCVGIGRIEWISVLH